MPKCINPRCQQQTLGTNLCALCANTLPAHHDLWKEMKVASPSPGKQASTQLTLETVLQDAAKVQAKGDSTLASNMSEWVGYMCTFLDSRGYWNSKDATSVGDQNTPNNCKVGTTSLDFQGVRAGSEGTYWIDLQGQIGGGGSKRLTYCQVLIQTNVGGPVPRDTITAALLQSLKSGSKRAVIHPDGGKGLPN
jgi:hypothetical protein